MLHLFSPAKQAKRVLESGTPSFCNNMNVEDLNVMTEIKKFLFTESNRVSKAAYESILKCVS